MTTATMKAKMVRIQIERDASGLLFATSGDLKGLLVAKHNRADLEAAIPDAITALYAACGVKVVVTAVEDSDHETGFVAIPAEICAEFAARQ